MAVTTQTVPTKIETKRINDSAVGAAAQEVATSAITLFQVVIDNSGNSSEAVYLKLYDVASAPTLGTAKPDWQIPCPLSEKVGMTIPEGIAFANGLFYAVSKEAGVPTTTSPSANVALVLRTS